MKKDDAPQNVKRKIICRYELKLIKRISSLAFLFLDETINRTSSIDTVRRDMTNRYFYTMRDSP